MTVNPDAGISAPTTFDDQAVYAFRFNLDGDLRKEVTYKVRFSAPFRASRNLERVQAFEVRCATDDFARSGPSGELILRGSIGSIFSNKSGSLGFAALTSDPFAGDRAALGIFQALR